MTGPTPRRRLLSLGAIAILLVGAGPPFDPRYQRASGGFGRVEGRPDRDEVLNGALPYGPTGAAYAVGLRPYERQPVAAPVAAPAPRRQYYPSMRPNQYTSPGVGRAHCTPSRGALAGYR